MNEIFAMLAGLKQENPATIKERVWYYQYPHGQKIKIRKGKRWDDGKGVLHSSLRDAKDNLKYYGAKVWSELL